MTSSRKRLAFDIGANIGSCTDILIRKYDVVVSVEPIKRHCEYIRNRFCEKRVTVVNALVSDKDDMLEFYECDTISTVEKRWVENSRFSKSHRWSKPISVRSISMPSLIKTYGVPDFAKIDVEGHELNVITSLSNCGSENIPQMIAFEWAEEFFDKIEKSIRLLSQTDYIEFSITYMHDNIENDPAESSWKELNETVDVLSSFKTQHSNHSWGMIWARK